MKELRRERKYLAEKRKYIGYDRALDRRLDQIGYELEGLKSELKYLKKRRDYRGYDRDHYRDSYYYKTRR